MARITLSVPVFVFPMSRSGSHLLHAAAASKPQKAAPAAPQKVHEHLRNKIVMPDESVFPERRSPSTAQWR
jgi:hypothetical protein